jgi:hypothetical protein
MNKHKYNDIVFSYERMELRTFENKYTEIYYNDKDMVFIEDSSLTSSISLNKGTSVPEFNLFGVGMIIILVSLGYGWLRKR